MPVHVAVIDPAIRVPELDVFNQLSRTSPVALTHHLPALYGFDSLVRDDDELAGVLVLGSGASVHDALGWQASLIDWLRPRLLSGVPTLGLCFGHQLLAHMHGGAVGFLHPDHHKRLGLREIALEADPLWGDARTVPMVVSHREVVMDVPEGFAVVGRSDEVAVEAMAHRTLPIWGLQAHPEATAAFCRNNAVPFTGPPRALQPAQALVSRFISGACDRSLARLRAPSEVR